MSSDELPVAMRCLAGSRSYGLERPDSDYDYREVFITPTRLMVGLNPPPKEGWGVPSKHTDDISGWELGKWLTMVRKGSPNATELLWAPLEVVDNPSVTGAAEIRVIGESLLTRTEVARATLGYATNSFRKIEGKGNKWRVGYLRALIMGRELLFSGRMSFPVIEETLLAVNAGRRTDGEVLDYGRKFEHDVAYLGTPDAPGPLPVELGPGLLELASNKLLKIRKENW